MNSLLFCFLILLFATPLLSHQVVRYDGEKVIRIHVETKEQLSQLKEILGETADVWSNDGTLLLGSNDVRVNKPMADAIDRLLLPTGKMIDDLQQAVENFRAENEMALGKKQAKFRFDASWFDAYHRYADIVAFMVDLAKTYPHLAVYIPSIGKSVEGRNIPALRLNASYNGAQTKRIWFNGGQHAREWIGPATVLYVTNQLLSLYGKDTKVTAFLQECEFNIVPLMNPDGYEYAWTNDRLWRKNRRQNNDLSYGVDLNRNWDVHWGGEGSSSIPRSDTYHGTAPFSEPETRSISSYLLSLPNTLAGIDFHSYSQLILRPYGWTDADCPDEKALKTIGDGVSAAIKSVHGQVYTSEKSIDLYITTGTASDWFYSSAIWGAYTIELRDTGRYGFLLPASEIIPTGEEIWNSMIYFIQTVLDTHPGWVTANV